MTPSTAREVLTGYCEKPSLTEMWTIRQVLRYANDYQQSSGYLVVFNCSNNQLVFPSQILMMASFRLGSSMTVRRDLLDFDRDWSEL